MLPKSYTEDFEESIKLFTDNYPDNNSTTLINKTMKPKLIRFSSWQ